MVPSVGLRNRQLCTFFCWSIEKGEWFTLDECSSGMNHALRSGCQGMGHLTGEGQGNPVWCAEGEFWRCNVVTKKKRN
jgi:hypothetical protein